MAGFVSGSCPGLNCRFAFFPPLLDLLQHLEAVSNLSTEALKESQNKSETAAKVTSLSIYFLKGEQYSRSVCKLHADVGMKDL